MTNDELILGKNLEIIRFLADRTADKVRAIAIAQIVLKHTGWDRDDAPQAIVNAESQRQQIDFAIVASKCHSDRKLVTADVAAGVFAIDALPQSSHAVPRQSQQYLCNS